MMVVVGITLANISSELKNSNTKHTHHKMPSNGRSCLRITVTIEKDSVEAMRLIDTIAEEVPSAVGGLELTLCGV